MNRSAPWRIGALTAIVLMLSACFMTPSPVFTELSDPQEPGDLLPKRVPGNVDPGSTRFVGTLDGTEFYLDISADPGMRGGPCIIHYDGLSDGTGCGASGGEVTVEWVDFGSARYLPPASAGLELPQGWTRISTNLIVKPAA
ncbi:MAG: hypothetical protein ABWY23_10635 [Mycetocola sp.]